MPVLRLIGVMLVILIGSWFVNHNVLKVEDAIKNWGPDDAGSVLLVREGAKHQEYDASNDSGQQ